MIINGSLKTQNPERLQHRIAGQFQRALPCGTRILRVVHGRDARATCRMSDFSDAITGARRSLVGSSRAGIDGMPFVLDIPFAIIYFVISGSNQ
jgi:hypothetical protein